jgi:hypothetical protein
MGQNGGANFVNMNMGNRGGAFNDPMSVLNGMGLGGLGLGGNVPAGVFFMRRNGGGAGSSQP